MKPLLFALAVVFFLARPAAAATYTCTNGQYVAGANITLTGADTVSFVGTTSARCTVLMKGFGIHVANGDTTFSGSITIQNADLFDCGGSVMCIGGSGGVTYLYLNGATVTIEDSVFRRSSGIEFYSVNAATIAFRRNTIAADSLWNMAYVSYALTGVFYERGTSTATKSFQGNKIYHGWVGMESPNWVVGAPTTCASAADDALGNLIIGARAGIDVKGAGSTAICNYTHSIMDATPAVPFWADVENITGPGSGSTVKHNLIRAGQWMTTSPVGTLTDNVYTEYGASHEFVRSGANSEASGAVISNNIMAGLRGYAHGQRYGSTYSAFGGGETALGILHTGVTWTVRNNTIDATGHVVIAGLWVASGSTVNWRNNVITGLILNSSTCPGTNADQCSQAIGSSQAEGYVTPEPERLSYSDYNDTFFDSSSTRKIVYGVRKAATNVCDDDNGLHDLRPLGQPCNGQGVDPVFKGPLPKGCGRWCGVNTTWEGSGFPFHDEDLKSGRYGVHDILAYYRWVYAPGTGSPLLNAQDPADGTNHMGAVRSADIPGSAPALVNENKWPMVWAGPSFTTGSTEYGGTVNDAQLAGFATDDNQSGAAQSCSWRQVNGPGTATFDATNRCSVTVTNFTASGTYTFRLTATDGVRSSWMDVRITKP